MAAPILQLRKGTTTPGSIFYAAEPVYNTTGKILYVGDAGGTGTGAGSAIAGAATYASALEILTKSVASTSAGAIKLLDAQATQNTLTFRAPATVTTSYSFTLPAAVPAGASGYFMTSDTSGNTSWSQVGISAVTGLGTGVATFLATPSSANLATAVTDETGSGALVFGTSPSLTTPALAGETFSTTNNVTAGTNAQGQGALTTDISVITTAAAAPSGVTLPTATQGRRIVIVNKGANTVNIYPATGASIDALAANAFIALPVNGLLEFNASSTTQWYSSFNSSITGTGVTSFQTSLSGLTPSTATGGAVTLAGTLGVTSGGTGATSASITAFNNITGYTATGATGTTSTNLVFSTSPSLTTPSIAGGTISGLTAFAIRDTSAAFDVTLAATSSTALTAGRTVTIDVVNAARTIKLAGNLDFAGNFTTSGAFATTITTTNTTSVTLPTSGTLYGTASASISSSQLATSLSDETGTGVVVFGTSPTITTSIVAGSASFDVFNTTATTVNAFGAATTLAIGNTATAAQTVNMFTASTGASTYNIATGATATATTKAINIGTNGAAGSTTNITIGGSAGTSTTTVNGDLTVGGNLTVSGSTTILNTQTLQVEDRFIELGLINAAAPTASTTWDTAIGFNYFATTAKKSALVWLDNTGFALASELAVASGDTGTTAADPQITITTHAPLAVGSLFIGALATATNEVITSARALTNVTIDCGTY